jgi:hypothetical protein
MPRAAAAVHMPDHPSVVLESVNHTTEACARNFWVRLFKDQPGSVTMLDFAERNLHGWLRCLAITKFGPGDPEFWFGYNRPG